MSTFSGADSMTSAVQRIVVQASAQDKKSIVAKAKKLDIPMSELMRRGAFAYQSGEADAAFGALADAAKAAGGRAGGRLRRGWTSSRRATGGSRPWRPRTPLARWPDGRHRQGLGRAHGHDQDGRQGEPPAPR